MHWTTPTTMLTSFVAGITFAIGHHFFYQSLDGSIVVDATFDQQINIGVGTAFAFLVRSALALAIGTAFVQLLCQTLLHEELTISRIDSASQLLTSLWSLFNFKTLWHHPLLAFVAIISWTLPFAGIVPPATLSVKSPLDPQITEQTLVLPYIDFSTSALAKTYVADPPSRDELAANQLAKSYHGGSSDDLTQLAFGVAFQGTIPAIRSPALNSSYTERFFGPSVQCQLTDPSIVAGFDDKFGCSIYNSSASNRCSFGYTYLAWVPVKSARVDLSASNSTGQISFVPNYDGSGYGLTTSGGFQDEPTTIYIGTRFNYEWSVLNCSLYNASYTVNFNYDNGNQTLNINRELHNSLPFINLVSEEMLANITGYPPSGTITYAATPEDVSYQAMMDSFGQIMVGGMMYAITRTGGGTNTMATSIMRTRLRSCLSSTNANNDTSCPSLANAVEELFQNITLSALSSDLFTTVDEQRFPSVKVTLMTYDNIYVYTWRRLVLAYGLAVLFTTVAVLIGGIALLKSGESYSFTFSTILRTTRQKACDDLIEPTDRGGQDPLPDYIGKAKIMVGDESKATALGLADREDSRSSTPTMREVHNEAGENRAAQAIESRATAETPTAERERMLARYQE